MDSTTRNIVGERLWLRKTLWASLSLGIGLVAGVLCVPVGMLVVAVIFGWATHGRDEGLGAGIVIGFYGLMLGVAIGTAATTLLTRWIYRRRLSD
jgi:hypothetical protein